MSFFSIDVGNYFGVTCFWKVEVDFGLWSWGFGVI
jgi:hypothetical protein